MAETSILRRPRGVVSHPLGRGCAEVHARSLVCFLVLFWGAFFPSVVVANPNPTPVPEIDRAVVDYAKYLGEDAVGRLGQRLVALREATGVQMAIVTVPTTRGEPIDRFGLRAARQWRGGDRARHDGVLLIVVTEDRATRLEVGIGLTGRLTNKDAATILAALRPALQSGAAEAGLNGVIEAVQTELDGDQLDRGALPAATSEGPLAVAVVAVLSLLLVLAGRFRRWQAAQWAYGLVLGGILCMILFGWARGMMWVPALSVTALLWFLVIDRVFGARPAKAPAPEGTAGAGVERDADGRRVDPVPLLHACEALMAKSPPEREVKCPDCPSPVYAGDLIAHAWNHHLAPSALTSRCRDMADGVDPDTPLACPVCAAEVKAKHLSRHAGRAHSPGTEGEGLVAKTPLSAIFALGWGLGAMLYFSDPPGRLLGAINVFELSFYMGFAALLLVAAIMAFIVVGQGIVGTATASDSERSDRSRPAKHIGDDHERAISQPTSAPSYDASDWDGDGGDFGGGGASDSW